VQDNPVDHLLHHVEREHNQAKHRGLPHRGNQQCLVFMSSAELRVLPDHNDLGDDGRAYERKGDGQIFDVVLPERQRVVHGKGTNEESQVKEKLCHPP